MLALSQASEALELVPNVDDRFNCRNQACTERREPILHSWGRGRLHLSQHDAVTLELPQPNAEGLPLDALQVILQL